MAKTKASNTGKDVLIVTQDGFNELTAELEHRKTTVRDEIAEDIRAAKDQGDLSENAAYSNAMERKEMNESRINELEYLISIAQVSSTSVHDNVIAIGHTVEIQKVGGKELKVVSLVGKAESQQANPAAGKISIDSPIGKALNMSRIGDTVSVELPSGAVKYKVLRLVA